MSVISDSRDVNSVRRVKNFLVGRDELRRTEG
jgi:hypothetical protein